jgi:hypothetical protein
MFTCFYVSNAIISIFQYKNKKGIVHNEYGDKLPKRVNIVITAKFWHRWQKINKAIEINRTQRFDASKISVLIVFNSVLSVMEKLLAFNIKLAAIQIL